MYSGVVKEIFFFCLLRFLENLKVGFVREIFVLDIFGIIMDVRILVMVIGGDFNNFFVVGEFMELGVVDVGYGYIEKELLIVCGGSWEIMCLMFLLLW